MISLLAGIIAGSIAGMLFGKTAEILKPIGDIFLNLLFVAVIPLVFFVISAAIANLQGTQKLGRIIGLMSATFLVTVLIAALVTIAAVWVFPIHQHLGTVSGIAAQNENKSISSDQITQLFSTANFFELLSRKNMLALIICLH